MQIPLFKPQTEWLPPENFPDLSKYDEIAIDLETKDPELTKMGSGSVVGKGDVVGIVGIDVKNGGVVEVEHGNYGYGTKGKAIAVISNPKNGIDVLVRAMGGVIKEIPNVKVLFIGDGDQKDELLKIAEQNGIYLDSYGRKAISEDFAEFDYIIENSGTIEDLVEMVEDLLKNEKIIE